MESSKTQVQEWLFFQILFSNFSYFLLSCWAELNGGDKFESLWVRLGKASKADILVGVCYRSPNQDEEVDEIFYKELGGVSQLLPLFVMGDFNFPDVC